MSQMLTESIARSMGASVGEDEHIVCEVGDIIAETRIWCTEFIKEADG